jgi:site-specific DNA-cytosine methylase
MKVLELFAGSCSFSNVAATYGFKTYTTDHKQYDTKINQIVDIFYFNINKVPFKPDIIWASPPCTTFSIASCGKHWTAPDKNGNREPKTEAAHDGLLMLEQTLWIIYNLQPKYYFIENPRGLMRKMGAVEHLPRYTVSYCQYGDTRMKPTDIWTNLEFDAKLCKNGATCHEAAPRGSKTGTQGLKNNYERSKIPYLLCREIIETILHKEND